MRMARFISITSFLGALAFAGPAAAQNVAAADALFQRGLADMEAGKYDTACPALAESFRLDPQAGALFTLADCEAQRGHIATAVARYSDFIAFVDRLPPDQQPRQHDRLEDANRQKAALTPQIPTLTLTLPKNAPPGTVVKQDGEELGGPSLGVPLPVDPGEHIVTTLAPGGPVVEVKIQIAKGEKKEVTLEVKPATPAIGSATAVLPAPGTGPSGRRVGAYVAGGLGVAGLVIGGVMGGLTFSKKGSIDANCDASKRCNPEGKAAADTAVGFALVSDIGFGVGIAGLGTAAVLLLTEPAKAVSKSASPPSRAPLNAKLVLSFGPDGALAGLSGDW